MKADTHRGSIWACTPGSTTPCPDHQSRAVPEDPKSRRRPPEWAAWSAMPHVGAVCPSNWNPKRYLCLPNDRHRAAGKESMGTHESGARDTATSKALQMQMKLASATKVR